MNLKEQLAAKRAVMQSLIDRSKAEGRDLTVAEARQIDTLVAEYKQLSARLDAAEKAARLVSDLAAAPEGNGQPPEDARTAWDGPGRGSGWTKAALQRMSKSMLEGTTVLDQVFGVPPMIEVVELPETPTRLLDLIAREPLDAEWWIYLRQVARENAAGVVPDGEIKPQSTYTFKEISDRARVFAHLSEPFPVRYLSDYASMTEVLDSQMLAGIRAAIEQQAVNGSGEDDEWEGLLTLSGVQDVEYEGDRLLTIRHARTVLENLGEVPSAWVLNPTDLEALDMLREDAEAGTGGFLVDSAAADTIFGRGVRRVPSLAVPAGTALLADWSQVKIKVRENAQTLASMQASDFWETNRTQLRCEGRYGFEVKRPQAVAVVHLDGATTPS